MPKQMAPRRSAEILRKRCTCGRGRLISVVAAGGKVQHIPSPVAYGLNAAPPVLGNGATISPVTAVCSNSAVDCAHLIERLNDRQLPEII
jgi:hypothetical protein